ncbi:efflux RND transporter periplasmic adaptor subunit [Lonepinella koalarum]|uniref:Macrolide-specific efflux system membrane fusion protein n=1 Tax=Lonepinella koalarum TaxID=53417 RepID=A0A4R1L041_9PAST|nr:efflux RND transporter periplasmic adaptor subunit [Lonepinella koalarum]MDH2927016.1 efflux transporter periplasmic adaptor subunit [Lonepinella koalarum]TCK70327.1 macrolide-specific efflux system membrane fusion protein [Lonepinella koalarum]TFJ89286.1 efflux RND transporter periplasmic adaptor subunit [Lonepinella koalarum]TYG33420.1 efflux RND transporter periplasmic adaptor subunit [Lonepinella koalarum]
MKKKLFIAAIVLALCGSCWFYFKADKDSQITYLTETVNRGNLQKSVIASGTVRSYNRVEVGAQVSGKIEKIHVILGQEVKEGDLIAEIDSKTQVNNLNTAQAQLSSYQAQLKAKKIAYDVALSAYNRIAKLYKQNSATLDDLNSAKNTLSSAEADIETVQASIKQSEIEVSTAQTNLGYTKIVSPLNGTVISIPVSVGQTVNANQTTPTIVQVADLSKMLVKPEISEGDITKVKQGMSIEFTTLSDPNTKYHAQINSVDPAMTTLTDNGYTEDVTDTNAVYYYANVVVDNPDGKLRIGMTTQNTITIADVKDALLVPTTSLQNDGNQVYVNVLNNDKQVEKREVTIGLNDDVNTQILSGLNEGEKVITSQVAEGETVGNSNRGPRLF